MPGKRGKGNPRKSDRNPHKVAKHKSFFYKLEQKKKFKKEFEKKRREYWKNNKEWQEKKKKELMKKLKRFLVYVEN